MSKSKNSNDMNSVIKDLLSKGSKAGSIRNKEKSKADKINDNDWEKISTKEAETEKDRFDLVTQTDASSQSYAEALLGNLFQGEERGSDWVEIVTRGVSGQKQK